MDATLKSPALKPNKKTWMASTGTEKAWFVAKVCIMVCSFGFVFGGVLVEGMQYETYENL